MTFSAAITFSEMNQHGFHALLVDVVEAGTFKELIEKVISSCDERQRLLGEPWPVEVDGVNARLPARMIAGNTIMAIDITKGAVSVTVTQDDLPGQPWWRCLRWLRNWPRAFTVEEMG